MRSIDWRKVVVKGSVAGVISGWLAMALNQITGAFPFESSMVHNLATFAVGGAVFGIAIGGFMAVAREQLPFKTSLPKAIMISTGFWLILRIGGQLMSIESPGRFHPDWGQSLQGLVIAVIFGTVLGTLWGNERENGI